MRKLFLLITCSALLASCGGGGGKKASESSLSSESSADSEVTPTTSEVAPISSSELISTSSETIVHSSSEDPRSSESSTDSEVTPTTSEVAPISSSEFIPTTSEEENEGKKIFKRLLEEEKEKTQIQIKIKGGMDANSYLLDENNVRQNNNALDVHLENISGNIQTVGLDLLRKENLSDEELKQIQSSFKFAAQTYQVTYVPEDSSKESKNLEPDRPVEFESYIKDGELYVNLYYSQLDYFLPELFPEISDISTYLSLFLKTKFPLNAKEYSVDESLEAEYSIPDINLDKIDFNNAIDLVHSKGFEAAIDEMNFAQTGSVYVGTLPLTYDTLTTIYAAENKEVLSREEIKERLQKRIIYIGETSSISVSFTENRIVSSNNVIDIRTATTVNDIDIPEEYREKIESNFKGEEILDSKKTMINEIKADIQLQYFDEVNIKYPKDLANYTDINDIIDLVMKYIIKQVK